MVVEPGLQGDILAHPSVLSVTQGLTKTLVCYSESVLTFTSTEPTRSHLDISPLEEGTVGSEGTLRLEKRNRDQEVSLRFFF